MILLLTGVAIIVIIVLGVTLFFWTLRRAERDEREGKR